MPLSHHDAHYFVLAIFLYQILQEFVLKKLFEGKKLGIVGKAQLKIASIVIYYNFIGVSGLILYTSFFVGNHAEKTRDFVECESNGASGYCVFEGHQTIVHNIFGTAIIAILSLLPVAAIVFICDLSILKRKKSKLTVVTKHITH